MKSLVNSQREYFLAGHTQSISFRIEKLNKLKFLLKENEERLYDAIYSDFKKSEFETYVTELALVYHDIDEAKKNLYKWSRTQKIKTNLTNFPAKSYRLPKPLGVCLVIGAWNYPYQLSLAPAVAAIAAGNTVVLKPSELPNETAKVMASIINANFDKGFFHVVQGGIPETTELLTQDFDKIFFTGSTKVGQIVYKAASKNLTPVTLELGGKSPAFITEKCNLKMTVKRLVWAKFLNAGQTCIAPDYVLVHKSREQEFLSLATSEIEKAKYAFEHDNYVQIINEKNFERLARMLDISKVYCGGTLDKESRYFEPTILQNVSWDDAVMQEEIFGPILPVISYSNLDKTIAKVKRMPRPLSCYVFSTSKSEKKKVLSQLTFGGGAVNDAVMHISNPNLPFGGVGQSGIGSYHGKAGFDCFTHYVGILDKPTWLELPIKYSPYSESKFSWIKRLMKL